MAKDLDKKKLLEEQLYFMYFRQIIGDYYRCSLKMEDVGKDIIMLLEVLKPNKEEPREQGMILALKDIFAKYKKVAKAYSQLSLAINEYRQEFFPDSSETV